jgi:hypothetical protein
MTLRTLTSTVLVLLLAAPPLVAQGTSSQTDVWRAFAEKLEPGTFVAVTLTNGKRVRGHFIQLSGDALRLKPKTRVSVPARDLALSDVELIQRQKEGWSSGRKVVTGVGVGVGVMFLIAAILIANGYD